METEWLDRLITEKRTAEDLSKLITEELGINYSVIVESEKITQEILSDIKTRKKNYFSNVPGVSYIDGRIMHSTFGYNLTVCYRYINFRDKNFFDDYSSKVPVLKNSFNVNTKTLTLTITAISGKVIEDTLYDTIQHELHHFFQEEKIGKPFNANSLYKIALACKRKPKNSLTYMLGDMLYITLKCEEEAYTNGLYAALVHNYRNDNIPTNEVLDNSSVYNALLTLRKEKEFILQNINDDELVKTSEVIRKITGKNINNIISFIERGEKELLRRIGRVIIKAQKDCSVPNDFHPNANKLTEYTKSTVDEVFSLVRLPESSPFTGFP